MEIYRIFGKAVGLLAAAGIAAGCAGQPKKYPVLTQEETGRQESLLREFYNEVGEVVEFHKENKYTKKEADEKIVEIKRWYVEKEGMMDPAEIVGVLERTYAHLPSAEQAAAAAREVSEKAAETAREAAGKTRETVESAMKTGLSTAEDLLKGGVDGRDLGNLKRRPRNYLQKAADGVGYCAFAVPDVVVYAAGAVVDGVVLVGRLIADGGVEDGDDPRHRDKLDPNLRGRPGLKTARRYTGAAILAGGALIAADEILDRNNITEDLFDPREWVQHTRRSRTRPPPQGQPLVPLFGDGDPGLPEDVSDNYQGGSDSNPGTVEYPPNTDPIPGGYGQPDGSNNSNPPPPGSDEGDPGLPSD